MRVCVNIGLAGFRQTIDVFAIHTALQLEYAGKDSSRWEVSNMRQTLEETLEDLHRQLSSAENLDQEQREKLRLAAEEIQQTLDDSSVSSFGLAQRLQQATAHFEHTHPRLTNTVGRIADLLAQMGI
jgi:predicted  nucleic acid-binding Zn-ribbon protein